MNPAEWEHASAALDECLRHRRHCNSHAYELLVLVHDKGDVVEAQHGDIHADVAVNLSRSERRVAVKLRISLIDELENLLTVILHELLCAGVFGRRKLVFALYDVADALVTLRNAVGYRHAELYPVGFLLKAHSLKVLGIVGIVVDGSHRTLLVETFHEHTLGVHVAEAERAYNLLHALRASPHLHGAEKSLAHTRVVDEIHPAEAQRLLAGLFIHHVVDDSGNASHGLSVVVSHEVDALAEVESRVVVRVERVHVVHHKRRNEAFVALVEVDAPFHELL